MLLATFPDQVWSPGAAEGEWPDAHQQLALLSLQALRNTRSIVDFPVNVAHGSMRHLTADLDDVMRRIEGFV
jgi:hypothetical protein